MIVTKKRRQGYLDLRVGKVHLVTRRMSCNFLKMRNVQLPDLAWSSVFFY